jgi:site-specific DNA recombinase
MTSRQPATVSPPKKLRCAVYTRKSSEEGLEMEFNSLEAQRESCEAYVASQRPEGWILVPDRYDDGGFSGGTLERPALKRLRSDIEAGQIDVVVVYKIDRLSRSLMDFSRLVEVFDQHKVTFVSVTQSFNTYGVPTPIGSGVVNARSKQSCPAQGLSALPPGRGASEACCGRDPQ